MISHEDLHTRMQENREASEERYDELAERIEKAVHSMRSLATTTVSLLLPIMAGIFVWAWNGRVSQAEDNAATQQKLIVIDQRYGEAKQDRDRIVATLDEIRAILREDVKALEAQVRDHKHGR